MSSYQVSGRSDKYILHSTNMLWIDLKISISALHSTSWREIEKSSSRQLCELMSSIILSSFSSMGFSNCRSWKMWEFTNGWTDTGPTLWGYLGEKTSLTDLKTSYKRWGAMRRVNNKYSAQHCFTLVSSHSEYSGITSSEGQTVAHHGRYTYPHCLYVSIIIIS